MVRNDDQLKDLYIDMTKLFASGDLEGKTIAGWVIVKKLAAPNRLKNETGGNFPHVTQWKKWDSCIYESSRLSKDNDEPWKFNSSNYATGIY